MSKLIVPFHRFQVLVASVISGYQSLSQSPELFLLSVIENVKFTVGISNLIESDTDSHTYVQSYTDNISPVLAAN